jgi:hypothetical protein
MKYFNQLSREAQEELIGFTIENLNNLKGSNILGCDLHDEIFNTDYYIIGSWKAEQWLIKNIGIFEAIRAVYEYEELHFGEVTTNFSESEHLLDMLIYIIGEEILMESETLMNKWDRYLSKKDFDAIINEVRDIIKDYQ